MYKWEGTTKVQLSMCTPWNYTREWSYSSALDRGECQLLDLTVGAIRKGGRETGCVEVQLDQTGLEQGQTAGLCGDGDRNLGYIS